MALEKGGYCNFAKAIIEPEKAIPPMIRLKTLLIGLIDCDITSDKDMQTDDNPPKALKTATICGRAVILLLKAT